MASPFNPSDVYTPTTTNPFMGGGATNNIFGAINDKQAGGIYENDTFGGDVGLNDQDLFKSIAANPNDPNAIRGLRTYMSSTGKTPDQLAAALSPYMPAGSQKLTGKGIADWLGIPYTGGTGDIMAGFAGLQTPTSWRGGGGSNRSGLDDETRDDVKEIVDQVKDWLPFYEQSMTTLMGLPDQIDEWQNDLSRRYRVSGDDIVNTMTEANNRRAAKGIMGGTESENITSNLLGGLRESTQQQQNEALNNAITQKIGAIAASPALAALPMDMITNLFNELQESLGSSWSGGQTNDTTPAWNLMSQMLTGGYTG